ncbi:MAG: hypothetical protein MZV63_57010 [Marinilabiliales bacterium]|nr:hypothetical protein [Marinilabiliales bacterium]
MSYLIRNKGLTEEMEGFIKEVGDLERLLSKAAVGRVNPREVCPDTKSTGSHRSISKLLCTDGRTASLWQPSPQP